MSARALLSPPNLLHSRLQASRHERRANPVRLGCSLELLTLTAY